MSLSRWYVYGAALLVVLGTIAARAEDRDLAFIHGLVAQGYPDVAVDYLNEMKDKPALSAGAKDLWDLEMSKALRAQALTIADPTERDSLNTKAQQYLEEFAKEKPNHPEALQAELTTAAAIIDQGNELLALARTTDDAKEKAATIVAARKDFEQAKPMLERGLKKLDERIAAHLKLKPPGPTEPNAPPSKKFKDWLDEQSRLDVEHTQAEGRLALIDYYRAQTFTDPADNEVRRKALGESYNRLDDIYQRNRAADPNSLECRFALLAHSWSGRAAEELGDITTAKDIYDEVLVNLQSIDAQNPKYQKTDVDDVLARTKHFSLMLMLKSPKRAADYEDAARKFVQNEQYKKALNQEWGYQAAELELAKHILADADKETNPSVKKRLVDEALKLLKEMAGVRSEFQREAIILRNKASGNAEETAQNATEAMAYADGEIKKGNWARALYWLNQAKAFMAGKKIEAKDAAHVTELIAACELAPIDKDFDDTLDKDPAFNKEKYLAWYEGFNKIARNPEYKKTDSARDAATHAVYCAATLYGSASDIARHSRGEAAKQAAAERDEANKRLKDITGFVIAAYPQSAEADDARMKLAIATLLDGNLLAAAAAFESIDSESEKYTDALIAAGKVRYQLYFAEKKQAEAKRETTTMQENLTKAIAHLSEAISLIQRKLKPGDPYPDSLMETQVLLAQAYLEREQNKEALAVLQPLIEAILKLKPTELSDLMVEMFRLGVRANLRLKNFDEAGRVGGVLIDLGPDNPRVNGTLVQFIQRVDAERRALVTKLNDLPDDKPEAELDGIRNDLQSIITMLGNMLLKMSSREQLNAESMVYIGQLFGELGMIDESEKQYGNLLKKADEDPEFRKDAEKLFAWVRSQQVELLRKRGKYAEALEQAKKLSDEYKGALEPLVSQAEILQAWAEKEPSDQRYEEAISKWTEIRRGLEAKRKRPPAYYDSVYNTAALLLSQAKALLPTNKEAALEKGRTGEQVIYSLLMEAPNLDGTAETKTKFLKLKNKLVHLRGGKPETALTAPGFRPAPAPAAGASP